MGMTAEDLLVPELMLLSEGLTVIVEGEQTELGEDEIPQDDDEAASYAPGRVYWGPVTCTIGFADITSKFDLPFQVNAVRARNQFLGRLPTRRCTDKALHVERTDDSSSDPSDAVSRELAEVG